MLYDNVKENVVDVLNSPNFIADVKKYKKTSIKYSYVFSKPFKSPTYKMIG